MVMIWTEANVPSRAREVLRKTFWEKDDRLYFSRPVDRGRGAESDDEDQDKGKIAKVTWACRRGLSPIALQAENGQDAILLDSGRWIERLVPIGDGQRCVIVAGFYGISWASGDAGKRVCK